jgi:MoaA/NifB/PqqE/SkfB family radical SAM enzyme
MSNNPGKLCISLTNKCRSNCDFCGSPNRRGRDLPISTALDSIAQAKEVGIKYVAFTGGGDPLIRYGALLKCVGVASLSGIKTHIKTNAYRFNDRNMAQKDADELSFRGLRGLGISFDYDHAKHVPFECYPNAIYAFSKKGIPVFLNVTDRASTRKENRNLLDRLEESLGGELCNDGRSDGMFFKDGSSAYVNHYVIERFGRAKEFNDNEFLGYEKISVEDECASKGIMIESDGNISTCCSFFATSNPSYSLGNLKDISLKDALSLSETLPEKISSRKIGLGDIVRAIRESGDKEMIKMLDKKTSPCEFCSNVVANDKVIELMS